MNKQLIIDDVKLLMGAETIRLELTDDEISRLSDKAFRTALPYISDVVLITKPFQTAIDLTEEKVCAVTNLISSVPGVTRGLGAIDPDIGFDFEMYIVDNGKYNSRFNTVKRSAQRDFNIPFRFEIKKDSNGELKRTLYPSKGRVTNNVTIECIIEPEFDEVYDTRLESWISSYTLALAKEVVGRKRGKFKSSNVPVEIDSDNLLSEAQQEKERLISELSEQGYGLFTTVR